MCGEIWKTKGPPKVGRTPDAPEVPARTYLGHAQTSVNLLGERAMPITRRDRAFHSAVTVERRHNG